ncbi:putative methyltransferase DDB_G0268948 isoform X2 [Oratosquilla oratoria]|uniref:putative methyltransferase DDB_G0268948 isoform X2 n=1 Tax=Oratosquilla oratoria TaxID=337810 RepID=UPI003F76249F
MGSVFCEGLTHAAMYARFRPQVPASLVNYILSFLQEKCKGPMNNAIDVGCGSGQSTRVLSSHFKNVVGFDISEAQVAEANKLEKLANVSYKVNRAEKLPCETQSVQLVNAGQACHWFDLSKFFIEADRVLVPGGVIALYGYQFPMPIWENKTEKLTKLFTDLYLDSLHGYIKKESLDVYYSNYRNLRFRIPFEDYVQIRNETLYAEHQATVADFVGYISSWSSFQNFQTQHGQEAAYDILNTFETNHKVRH